MLRRGTTETEPDLLAQARARRLARFLEGRFALRRQVTEPSYHQFHPSMCQLFRKKRKITRLAVTSAK